MAVYETILTDTQDKHTPPDKVLAVSVIGDEVFLSFNTYSETHDSQHMKTVEEISVNYYDLMRALGVVRVESRP